MAVGMIVLYVVSLVVHQIVQPKLIGDSVGLDPFASLLFMFIGYRVGSVVGMILAIPIGMILINLYEAGAFDTLVWCVREVVNDFNNFRKVGGEKKSHRFAERNDMFIHFSSLKVLIKHIFTSLIMLTPVG